jgi:Carboxypeptidase regulatory-like domain/TonB-dependent Receptor Plug Domain
MNNQACFRSGTNFKSCAVLAICCVLIVALSCPGSLKAQVTTAAVRGTVTDDQKAAVAGASVTITNVGTAYSRSVQSGSDGEYSFTDLPLGSYRIHAEHTGFKSQTQTGIELHVTDSIVVNIVLKVGAVTETVTVEASPIAVETTNGELTGLVQGQQVRELPLNGRNFMELVTLMPGVATGEGFSSQDKGIKGGSDISISGSPSNGNLFLVDGGNNNDTGSNRTILVYPSVDSIEEFKIERNSYGAQFGLSAGGQVSIVTKSGSNDFHGSVYYFGRNDKLNAYDTILKGNSAPGVTPAKNKLRRNDFGYTVGGPVKKDKIFVFWSEEWNRSIEGNVRTAHVPTLAERAGNFSDLANCSSAGTGFPAGGLSDPDPTNANPFTADPSTPGIIDVIPAARISPASQVLMKQYPTPTNPNACTFNNWTKSLNVPTYWREESARGDINLTKSLTLMLKYTRDSWQIGPPSAGFGWGNNPLGVIDEGWQQPGSIATAKLSKTIGTTAVNDFQFSYSTNSITLSQANPTLVKQLNDAIPTFFPVSGKKFGDQGPSVWYSGWGNAHLPSVWTIAPWQNQQDLNTWQDDFSIVKGRHTLKFGGIYSRNLKNEQAPNAEFGAINGGTVGYLGCTNVKTQPACAAFGTKAQGFKTGYDVADNILLNMALPWSETASIFTNDIRWRNYEFYADDNWRVNNRLTVEFGARWSMLPNPYFEDDRYTTFNPSAYNPALGATPCNGLLYSPNTPNPCPPGTGGVAGPNRSLWNNNWHTIAPRLGIAWDPTGRGKWAIRGGAGQFFNRDRLHALQIGGSNPPFIQNFTDLTGNGRFLDNTNPTLGCTSSGAAGCFGTGLGLPSAGNETSNQVPNSWQWNLAVQRELWRDSRLEVGYVGNHTIDWLSKVDANPVPIADRLAYAQSNASLGSVRPFFGLVGNNSINYWTRHGSSHYHALQTLFNTRFQRNSVFQASYTWSKLISDSPLVDSPTNLLLDAFNLGASRGLDPLNRSHIFSANLVYNLPTLQGWNSIVRSALGSWEAGTILNFAEGPSMGPVLGSVPNVSDPAGVGSGGAKSNEMPLRAAGQPCRGDLKNGFQWLNPNAFTLTGFKLGTTTANSVGACTGPPTSTVDFSMMKNFKVTERIKAQFRMEFFNLFNHPQYSAASVTNFANSLTPTLNFNYNAANGPEFLNAAGAPTNTLANAVSLQNLTPDPGFAHVGQSRETGWRQIQYALKFTF